MSMNNPISNIPPLGPPTGMMPSAATSKFKPIDPLRILRAKWYWLVLAMVVGGGFGLGTWYGLDTKIPKYTSVAQFDVQASNISASGRPLGQVPMNVLEPLILREVQKVRAEPTLRQTLNNTAVQQTEWFKEFNNNLDKAYEDLDENVLSANHIRDTPLFAVRATTRKAGDAQIILTALRDEYIRQKSAQVGAISARELQAAQSQLNTTEERITTMRSAIKRFLTATPLESLDERSSEAALRVQKLVIEVNEIEKSYNSLQATYGQLLERQAQGKFDPSDEERQMIENAREIVEIDSALRQLRVSRDSLLDKFKPEHAAVRSLDQQILFYERERTEEYDTQARTLFNAKLEQAALGKQILEQELGKTRESLAEWTLKRQEFVRLKQEYDSLIREQEQAEEEKQAAKKAIDDLLMIDESESRVTVTESFPPQKAKQTFPASPFVMVPGFAFMFTGIVTGLIFLREIMDQHVRSAADIKMIPDASLLGMIPSAEEDPSGVRTIDRVVEQQPSGLLAEAFRQIRTAVLSKIDRRGYKTLMIVSAKPGAGVTNVAQNLAASCALSGRRVLLIDANFRRPALAKLMGLNNQPGLAEILTNIKPIENANALIQRSSTKGLDVLTAGNTDQAVVEMFESPRFRELMARLEADYDMLIIDTPPALLTSDAQLLSRHVDAMLLVSRAKIDTRGILQRLYRELDGQRADILGVVLNGVEAEVGGYLKRNFREFHDYSGPDRRTGERASSGRSRKANNGDQAPAANLTADQEDEDVFDGLDIIDSDEQDR